MSESKGAVSRRDFVRAGSGAAVAGVLGLHALAQDRQAAPATSRVVLVRRSEAVGEDGGVRAEVVHEMFDQAVTTLLGEADRAAAWKRLVGPDDVVGIKTNAWHYLPTPPALEDAVRSAVLAAGVAPDNVAVDDRGVRSNPVFRRATALVNMRPMRSHHWSGLGTCLKNYIMFVERPADHHPDTCASLGSIWQLPELAGKTRLNVLVMLTPQFHGVGPHGYSPEYVWPYRGLIVGTDPVAVDATGARIMQAKRDQYFGKPSPISPPPHHIALADTRYHLGVSDKERIELVRLGWEEGALI